MTITRKAPRAWECKLFPNGEVALWRPKRLKEERLVPARSEHQQAYQAALVAVAFGEPGVWELVSPTLGLSMLRNSDISKNPLASRDSEGSVLAEEGDRPKTRYGTKGITRFGARIVRNAAHLIENERGHSWCSFATVTVPDLPMEQMAMVHENWDSVVELYRLGLRRTLQNNGLSGEIVTVSELQEKRYKRTGVPVLHLHSVFVGRTGRGKWAVSTERHDRLWLNALNAVLGIKLSKAPASCNIQRVNKSAEGYIGKYMSKGSNLVKELVAKGFSGWLPKQWWSCTHSLRKRIDAKTRRIHELADFLYDAADVEGGNIWKFHCDVTYEVTEDCTIVIARYGRLTQEFMRTIESYA